MLLMTALRLVDGVEQGPAAEDVTAGPLAFVVLLALALAVVLLGRSLVRQLRKAQAAKDAGVYGDEPVTSDEAASPEHEDPPRG